MENLIKELLNQGFEAKECAKQYFANCEENSYLFPLNTFGFIQSKALWIGLDAKSVLRGGTQFAEDDVYLYGGGLNVSFCN